MPPLKQIYRPLDLAFLLMLYTLSGTAQPSPRTQISLNHGWETFACDSVPPQANEFHKLQFKTSQWQQVNIPHNWDSYHGVRRMKHGNKHGYAWYRHAFTVPANLQDKSCFLFFEGVGSYATVWLNGKKVGAHAGGRTTFTLEVTDALLAGRQNLLSVEVGHPAAIRDLPWVCGGCSEEIGFSEGSQPMGIFRPVSLVITNELRIEPFGVQVWNDTTVTTQQATLFTRTEVKNYSQQTQNFELIQQLADAGGHIQNTQSTKATLPAGQSKTLSLEMPGLKDVRLWTLEDPYLYKLITRVVHNGKVLDADTTPYGIRWIQWPLNGTASKQFLLNGQAVFINGTAEYEHLLGQSHAFGVEQIAARAAQVKAAGYNAFRDAHQPHNLRYQRYWDAGGILWWPQFAAHIWFDNPAFKDNFKRLLVQWVKERRNSPSNILWGLENESTLPEAFARECADIIRSLDPTASSQRKITTCNGGSGTDWDVPQNWTGTYGGDPATYNQDLERQVLVGEYGAWRTLDLHSETYDYNSKILSEERMTSMMETKIRLAEQAKEKTTGHFHWLLYSHENPGRAQSGEGLRDLDRIGPVNYKGLFTLWGEPTDAFYMYRSNYAPAHKEPMVYIVSHTWPDRWTAPGVKDQIVVYSNCEEVELFNDLSGHSLGKRRRHGIGTHFEWNQTPVQYNLLRAVGYIGGKQVCEDKILLHHLPEAPGIAALKRNTVDAAAPNKGLHYHYRVNCGGPAYHDSWGNGWKADKPWQEGGDWGSRSWTKDFEGLPAAFASQRYLAQPVAGTAQWPLFQYVRFGQNQLGYAFTLPNGAYEVELYFTEPWYGIGGHLDAKGWRMFDVAINGKTVLDNLDIFQEAGAHKVLKKLVRAVVTNGRLNISFPEVKVGMAMIAAIAIGSRQVKPKTQVSGQDNSIIQTLTPDQKARPDSWMVKQWMQTGQKAFADTNLGFSVLPPVLYGATWLQTPFTTAVEAGAALASFTMGKKADLWIGLPEPLQEKPNWMADFTETKTFAADNKGGKWWMYKKQTVEGSKITLWQNSMKLPYVVAATEATAMDPAYDLKPTITSRPDNIIFRTSGIVTDSVNGRPCIRFTKAGGDTVVWQFSVGVADVYALRLRYVNKTDQPFEAKMILKAADQTVMKEETLQFNPYLPNKWGMLHTNTGSSINAGNYTITIISKQALGLSLNAMEIQ